MESNPRRAFIVVVDAWGIGALPDAPEYGDSPNANTMGSIDREAASLALTTFERLGLGNIQAFSKIKATQEPIASYGKMAEHSKGKDTTTGHWEMAGIYLDTPFPTYPEGFPEGIIEKFLQETACGQVLANIPASGTAIIEQFGPQHLETGFPIVYTSADSVFQIAAHIDKVPLETLYSWCETARRILQGEHQVSRVIARPFEGQAGKFKRLGGDRRDYAVSPPSPNVLTQIRDHGAIVNAVGKIEDIYCGVGVTHALHTRDNAHGLQVFADLVQEKVPLNQLSLEGKPLCDYAHPDRQLHFINLVETDMNYGHRRDVPGYAHALEVIDQALGKLLPELKESDLLLITGDHGCDPAAPGSDHTREYVPVFLYNAALPAVDLGTRSSFADIGQTVLDWLGIPGSNLPGVSLLQASRFNLTAV